MYRRFCIVFLLSTAGCLMGPDFESPSPELPSDFVSDRLADSKNAIQTNHERIEDGEWWKGFQDPLLVSLMERAENGNLDRQLAEARILEARANLNIATAGLFPTISLTGLARNNKNTTVVVGGAGGSSAAVSGTGSSSSSSKLYQAGFDATWELDLWGEIRRGREAALADLLSAEESAHATMLSMRAEIADKYFSLRGTQERIDLAVKNLESLDKAASLIREKYDAGFVTRLDLANAESEAATARSRIPPLRAQEQKLIFALSILLGEAPNTLASELSAHAILPALPTSVPLGLPSDLARRRPDIRKAEADLHGATARIGVAVANLFPTLSLTGSGGFRGENLSAIGDWAKRFWSYGANVSMPIFDGGRVVGNVDIAGARGAQSFLTYQKTVLTALGEVENTLTDFSLEQIRRQALETSVEQSAIALSVAMRQYQDGTTDYLNVISAQRNYYSAQDAFVQSKQTIGNNLIALYKALGGGWEEKPKGQTS